MRDKVWTVSQLTTLLKVTIENITDSIMISGEISNFKIHSSKHWFFTLKDSASQISVTFFKDNQKGISTPKDGDMVIIEGDLSLYAARGRYQLVGRKLSKIGIGELLLRVEKLKKELSDLGWFKEEYKSPIPYMPEKIGVITSPTGAVIQDIIKVVSRRAISFELFIYPVAVQGLSAANAFKKGIEEFNKHKMVEVIIIARGGGSAEDLMPFNERDLAEAIFYSKTPIISAIGHESDFTISDYVSDKRASTPSVAAEIVVRDQYDMVSNLERESSRILKLTLQRVEDLEDMVDLLTKHPWLKRDYFIDQLEDMLISLKKELLGNVKIYMEGIELSLNLKKELHDNLLPLKAIGLEVDRLEKLSMSLEASNPNLLLRRGYCIATKENSSKAISSKYDFHKEELIRLKFSDGIAIARMEK